MRPGPCAPLPLAATLVLASTFAQAPLTPVRRAPHLSLDHVVVAVNDLEKAAERFRALGFTLKPGRPHANGIRNWHAKFPDGTEIELLTAPEARDDLTRKYRQLLAQGDGAAFLALYPGKDAEPPSTPMPDYIFFGGLNFSPTDKPEHYQHPNTAVALSAVSIADPRIEEAIDEARGSDKDGRLKRGRRRDCARRECSIVLADGDKIHLLNSKHRLLPGRPIVGVEVGVRSLAVVQRVLKHAGMARFRVIDERRHALIVEPEVANGICLTFVERR